MNNNMEKEIFDIYVDDIIPNRFQPRLTFDEKSLNELADSIKQHGIIQPLVVRKIGDKYEIIAGERRYKASQIAGLQKVPAVIMNLDDKQSAEIAVIENIQRRDLTALEEAESYKKLLDKGYLTQEQLAARMGKAQATISNKLRLLGLDNEVKDALLNERISERHARSLLSLKNPSDQRDVLNKILTNKLTVRQTDDLIKTMLGEPAVETLDFMSTPINTAPTPSHVIVAPEIPIQTPVSKPVAQVTQPINEPVATPIIPFIENNPVGFAPVSNIDINQLKEGAMDINPPTHLADVDALLGIKPSQEDTQKPEETVTTPPSRFITSLEDEETNMYMPDTTTPSQSDISISNISVAPETNNAPEPQTYTDSLVQEFRQSNGVTVDQNKVIPGNIRSAINSVRDMTQMLEKNNFKIDVEEFDFEHLYQIIIKIGK